jgi:hypothetical protein
VCEGRTIVIGKPCSAYASCMTTSARSFARAYSRNRLWVGVDSVIGSCSTGLPYTEPELMYTYCPVRAPKVATARRASSAS